MGITAIDFVNIVAERIFGLDATHISGECNGCVFAGICHVRFRTDIITYEEVDTENTVIDPLSSQIDRIVTIRIKLCQFGISHSCVGFKQGSTFSAPALEMCHSEAAIGVLECQHYILIRYILNRGSGAG